MNASGCWCTTYEELTDLANSDSSAIVSKSSTINPREGNPNPRLKLLSNGSINSMGVPNHGFDYYSQFQIEHNYDIYIQSLMPFSLDDLDYMLKSESTADLYEINLSCPNIINKSILAYDFEELEKYLDLINNHDKIVGLKLPPYHENYQFDTVSNLLMKYNKNIKFITCINSIVNGLLIDYKNESTYIKPKNGFGGIGGIYAKPTALANVRQFYLRLNGIDIIGCGGVMNGTDAFEHILCGASAVQVGTQLMKEGPSVFDRLNNELIEIMNKKNYSSIDEFKGVLRIISESE
jgi:dihydroorotate dehydrogenase (fumarate)